MAAAGEIQLFPGTRALCRASREHLMMSNRRYADKGSQSSVLWRIVVTPCTFGFKPVLSQQRVLVGNSPPSHRTIVQKGVPMKKVLLSFCLFLSFYNIPFAQDSNSYGKRTLIVLDNESTSTSRPHHAIPLRFTSSSFRYLGACLTILRTVILQAAALNPFICPRRRG